MGLTFAFLADIPNVILISVFPSHLSSKTSANNFNRRISRITCTCNQEVPAYSSYSHKLFYGHRKGQLQSQLINCNAKWLRNHRKRERNKISFQKSNTVIFRISNYFFLYFTKSAECGAICALRDCAGNRLFLSSTAAVHFNSKGIFLSIPYPIIICSFPFLASKFSSWLIIRNKSNTNIIFLVLFHSLTAADRLLGLKRFSLFLNLPITIFLFRIFNFAIQSVKHFIYLFFSPELNREMLLAIMSQQQNKVRYDCISTMHIINESLKKKNYTIILIV